ncbi:MAG: hypothetical protein R3B54_14285 [Bdellovibrionota bacterium]
MRIRGGCGTPNPHDFLRKEIYRDCTGSEAPEPMLATYRDQPLLNFTNAVVNGPYQPPFLRKWFERAFLRSPNETELDAYANSGKPLLETLTDMVEEMSYRENLTGDAYIEALFTRLINYSTQSINFEFWRNLLTRYGTREAARRMVRSEAMSRILVDEAHRMLYRIKASQADIDYWFSVWTVSASYPRPYEDLVNGITNWEWYAHLRRREAFLNCQ